MVADADREVLEPLLEGLHDDLRISDNALEPVFGVNPRPFREAAGQALEELRADEGRAAKGARRRFGQRKLAVATNERFMPVTPDAVWDVLADPGAYGYWVVGSKLIRDADAAWPRAGSRFHHTVGVGPLTVEDNTEVVEARRPGLFRLRAKARPIGTALVTLEMISRQADGGTMVRLTENPDGLFAWLSLNPATHAFTVARNAESLMRLEELALLQDEPGRTA